MLCISLCCKAVVGLVYCTEYVICYDKIKYNPLDFLSGIPFASLLDLCMHATDKLVPYYVQQLFIMASETADHFPGLMNLLDEFRSISSRRHLPPSTEAHILHAEEASSCTADTTNQPPETAHTAIGLGLVGTTQILPTNNQQLPFLLSQEAHSLQLPFAASQEAQLGSRPLEDVHYEVQLPSEHLQCAGQSLPCLATELIAAQSSQVDELQRRRERLQQLQTQLAKGKPPFCYSCTCALGQLTLQNTYSMYRCTNSI